MKQSRQIVKSGETLIHRYRTQLNFRAEASLYLSLGINLLYAVYKAGTGIYYRSAWFGMTAFYYLILSTVRFFLLRGVRSKGQNLLRSFQKYRFCGWMLLILTLPIAGMGFYTIFEGHTAVLQGGHQGRNEAGRRRHPRNRDDAGDGADRRVALPRKH